MAVDVRAADEHRLLRSRGAVGTVFLSGFAIGIALILYPAAGPLFTSADYYGLTSAEYGLLFLPEILGAIVAALLVRRWGARLGVKGVMLAGTSSSMFSMVLFALTTQLHAYGQLTYVLLLIGTAATGIGFAATQSTLNVYAFEMFRNRPSASVTLLHMLGTIGSVSGPLILSVFLGAGILWGAPVAIVVLFCILLVLQARFVPSLHRRDLNELQAAQARTRLPRVWLWAALAVFYGCAEATFSNWGSIFANEDRGLSIAAAALALSVFWAAVTAGRAAFAVVAARSRQSLQWSLFLVSPFVMALAFFVLPSLTGTGAVIAGFALAGLGCSYFFPSSIGLASQEHPDVVSRVSGTMTAALFLGVGIGSNLPGFLRGAVDLGHIITASAGYALATGALAVFITLTRGGRREKPM